MTGYTDASQGRGELRAQPHAARTRRATVPGTPVAARVWGAGPLEGCRLRPPVPPLAARLPAVGGASG
ncbi:hypothetical protein, partial [Streptomyces pseudogriseolus]|uniref:hypothetical protein n=1 Tax=Streptomyces pseudogriseolus TaxID=36817 RepID=UPI003F9FB60A